MSSVIPQEDVALEFHEYANIFPELSDDHLAESAEGHPATRCRQGADKAAFNAYARRSE
jgi:hypothetical protein